jgi:hypothetical protein
MRIQFERSGGFVGRKITGSLDSSVLSHAQALRLKVLLKQSRFFELPSTLESSRPGTDQFSYRLTVESEEGHHTVEAGEAAIPDEMRPLLEYLTRSLLPKKVL